jgi:S-DNA-T family DNA segregation ATPase FtsK/SpoIIIE
MTTEHPGPGREHMAEVVTLRAENARTEAALDQTPAPAYVDTTGAGTPPPPRPPSARPGGADAGDGDRRMPIVPEHLRRDRIRATLAEVAGLHWYKARYHGFRSPLYAVKTLWYAIRGVFRLGGQLFAWANWADGWVLESLAVAAGRSGHHDAMNAHMQGRKTRATRWQITGVCFVLAVAVLLAMIKWLPWWGWAAFTVTAVVVLSRHGAPEGQRIVRAAVVPTAYQPPTPEVITRALGSLGITAINQVIKDGPGLSFVSDVHRDGDGWSVELDLPHGVTASDIIKKREALASGLRRPHSATWPEAVPHEHAGRLYLWVGRHDISKAKPVPYPLLRTGTADVLGQVPFAVTPRGQGVGAPLFETNIVVGAAPGQGKTTTVRVLGCGAALDVVCDLWIHELAGCGDLEPLAQVCHRYVSGLDDEAIAYVAESCRKLRAEVDRRGPALKALPREVRPDGKLTRELAEQRRLRLRPIGAIFDEIQNATMHPSYGPQIIDDLAYTERLGRKLGIFIILSTQRPDKESLPPKIRDLATVRFCLKVPDQTSNDMILGTGAYHAGYRASEFRPKIDAGLGWFKGEGDPQAVRTYYLDLNDTARIAARARAMREAAGVLSGYALGEASTEEARSFAADVLTIFAGANALWCETIAARLREHLPQVYADITQEAVASQLRGLGIDVRNVREPGAGPRKGCYRHAVEAVAGGPEPGDA